MVSVNYCPHCGQQTDDELEPFRPCIDCDNCGKIYMEVWTYE